MGDRGLAQVVYIAQARAKRGAQIGRGTARRANPGVRPVRAVMAVDWEAVGELSNSERRDVEAGRRKPPVRFKRWRRAGQVLVHRRLPLTRQQRRLAWKVERRATDVAWADSRAARGELAPVVPIRSRSLVGRLRAQPLVGGRVAADPMGDAA